MPTPWFRRFRRAKQLAVLNLGETWGPAVDSALTKFNILGFPVKLVPEKNKDAAQIVVKWSNGSETYPYIDGAKATANFDATKMHGQTSTLTDPKRWEIVFAVIFLPGKVTGVTTEQKEIIIIHEFIHACGLDGGLGNGAWDKQGQDHDSVGIMVANMKVDGKGLIEYMPEKNAKPMPPIRVGARTICKLKQIWTDDGCPD